MNLFKVIFCYNKKKYVIQTSSTLEVGKDGLIDDTGAKMLISVILGVDNIPSKKVTVTNVEIKLILDDKENKDNIDNIDNIENVEGENIKNVEIIEEKENKENIEKPVFTSHELRFYHIGKDAKII